ncbi:MAG: aminomethyl-transferring glycine dehydrogenase [Nitrospiraceae bacterium]|nr:aminomethyl-transferring glycine dehydrogenase [Nitrospiraceae bacterium]|tara:strand:- start:144 stop:1487 length:1344 start_codon:yes stop_codon:yes gene_type:complete
MFHSITPDEEQDMLKTIGVSSFEDLLVEVPRNIRVKGLLDLPPPQSELELRRRLKILANQNINADNTVCFLGAGAYDHSIPAIIPALASRSEFTTAYTPYQAERSQGLLQTIYEFQSMICGLTGHEVANASLYDGASALAEAALTAMRITKREQIVVSGTIHPHYRGVLKTYLTSVGKIIEIPHANGVTNLKGVKDAINGNTAAVMLQSPNFYGCLEELSAGIQIAHDHKSLAVVSIDPIALGLLKPPSEFGANITIGEGQGLGNPLSYGGPYVGFFATRKEYVRQIPGRLVGRTIDTQGRRGFCLTLQTREQHIRRDRATSNICTNQALIALRSTIYLAVMGKHGLRAVAEQCLKKAHYTYQQLCNIPGVAPAFPHSFFKEFVVKLPCSPATVNQELLHAGIIGGLDLGSYDPALTNHMLISVTEKRTRDEIDRLVDTIARHIKSA